MIDIIIPAYNAHKTIKKTLESIIIQTIKDKINVIIVNDASTKDYSEEIKLFEKFIKVKEIKLEKNSGPGRAKQYGLEKSNSPYIVFCDADDLFANCYSLENLFNTMVSDNNDMAIGVMLEEEENGYSYYENHIGCLHAKMYSRKYIEKNKFTFNNTRMSEDHSFNRLYTLSNPKIGYTDEIIYVYRKNNNSITRKKENQIESIKWYIYNAIWTVEEANKRGFSKEEIGKMIYSAICYTYFQYLELNQNEKIIEYVKPIYKYYKLFGAYIDNEDKIELYKYYDQINTIIPTKSFEEYLDMLTKK